MIQLVEFGGFPRKALARVPVGDTWNELLFSATDRDANGVSIPANLTGRTYRILVKASAFAKKSFMDLKSPDDFVLGQSEEAIQYDIDEGNPPGTTLDQLFVWAKPEQTDITPGRWHFDLIETTPLAEIGTMYQGPYIALKRGHKS